MVAMVTNQSPADLRCQEQEAKVEMQVGHLVSVGWAESGLHDALEDDDLVVIRAGAQRTQGLDVRGHVLQVVGPPHWVGQVGPALKHTGATSSER